jgi:hypothetical protein
MVIVLSLATETMSLGGITRRHGNIQQQTNCMKRGTNMRQWKLLPNGLVLLMVCAAHAQSTNHTSWLGVWQGELDGQPGVTLTLAEEDGELGGIIVFNEVSRESGTPRVIGSIAHMVMHPRVEGNTLSFDVRRPDNAKLVKMAVAMEGNDKMKMECVNCGEDRATTELVKSRP